MTHKIIISTLCLFLMTACGAPSSQSLSQGSNSDAGQNQQSSTPVNEEPTQPKAPTGPNGSFSASAGSLITHGSGFQIFKFNKDTNSIELSIPFPKIGGLHIAGQLPNHPDIKFFTEGSSLTISIPIKTYIEITKDPQNLPNGRPIFGVAGGEPPSLGFPLPTRGLNAYAYFAFDYIGVFIESNIKYNFPITKLSTNIKSDQDGSTIGHLAWYGPQNGQKAGTFVSIRLPRELSVYLSSLE